MESVADRIATFSLLWYRTATVIINGEVITGTDIDQRVALIVSASGGKIGDEELTRLRQQVRIHEVQ